MSDPRNRGTDRHHQKGPVSQRQLLRLLKPLIDASMGKASSATRDQSRAAVRRLMAEANWRTPFILQNIGARRARYLSSLGYLIDSKWLTSGDGDVERINAWSEGRHRG